LLPSERDDAGLQRCLRRFSIKDFREYVAVGIVDYAIGNWECKCSNLKACTLARDLPQCGASVVTIVSDCDVSAQVRTFNKNRRRFVTRRRPVAMQLKYDVNECQERGMTTPRSQGHYSMTISTRTGQRRENHRDIQGAGVFYGDIPLMTENGTFIITAPRYCQPVARRRACFSKAPTSQLLPGENYSYRGSWWSSYDTKNILYVPHRPQAASSWLDFLRRWA